MKSTSSLLGRHAGGPGMDFVDAAESSRGPQETKDALPRSPGDAAAYMSPLALGIRARSVKEWGEDRPAEMVGLSSAILEMQTKLEKTARYDEPVLITGESGVGKEMIAQAVYLLSERRGKPYVSVNCPLYQEGNLTVSELFGHQKGSFTGAIADRKGAFEQANGGVIFLDEIGDLHPSAQSMLLRALATGEYKPLGSDRPRSADVRVVAATNRPIEQLALDKNFRSDLLFRLHYFHLRIPPLRERENDWRLVLQYVLFRMRNRHGVFKRFSPAALSLMERYSWPGNVRQLVSVVTMGYAMADGDIIEPDDFAAQLEMGGVAGAEHPADDSLYDRVVGGGEDFWQVVYRPFMERDLNRDQVRAVLERGLESTRGSYQRVLDLMHVPSSDYQRFMDFLRHHRLKP